MKSGQKNLKKAAEEIGAKIAKNKNEDYQKYVTELSHKMKPAKDMLGMTDPMVEGIYAQAYRLYNTGKYKDASQLFRLLVMLNPTESKFVLGLGACFHLLKEYNNAIETYTICGMIDPDNPVPHYHISDCFIQLKDPVSALISLEMAVKRAEKPEFQTLKDRALLTLESLKKEVEKLKENPPKE